MKPKLNPALTLDTEACNSILIRPRLESGWSVFNWYTLMTTTRMNTVSWFPALLPPIADRLNTIAQPYTVCTYSIWCVRDERRFDR